MSNKNDKLDKLIERDIINKKIEIKIKDICFVCGRKIGNEKDSLARYYKQGNSCNECSVCSSFYKSSVPRKVVRYNNWCLRLDALKMERIKKKEALKINK